MNFLGLGSKKVTPETELPETTTSNTQGTLKTANGEKEVSVKKGGGFWSNLMQNRLVQGAVKWAVFKEPDLEASRELVEANLGKQFLKVIEAVVPKAKVFVENAIQNDYPSLMPLVENNEEFLTKFITDAFQKLFGNIAQSVIDKDEATGKGGKAEITDILKVLLKIFDEHFTEESIADYDEILLIKDPGDRKAALGELFSEMSEEILSLAFPNGQSDFGINSLIAGKLWSALKEGLIPQFCEKALIFLKKTEHHTKNDLKILEQPGGEALKLLSKLLADKSILTLKKGSEKHRHKILEVLRPYLAGDKNTQGITLSVLANRLSSLTKSENESINTLFDALHDHMESLFLHALANLAQDGKDFEGNIAAKAITNFLTLFSNFFTAEKAQQFEEIKKIADPKIQKESRKKLFEDFIADFLKKTNLENDPFIKQYASRFLPDIVVFIFDDFTKSQLDVSAYVTRLQNRLMGITAQPKENPEKPKESPVIENPVIIEEPEAAVPVIVKDESSKNLENPTGSSVEEKLSNLLREVQEASIPQEPIAEPQGAAPKNQPAGFKVEDLPKLLENSEIINQLESALGIAAGDVQGLIKKAVMKNKEAIAKALVALVPNANSKAEAELSEALGQLLGQKNGAIESALDFSQAVIKNALFRILVLVSEAEEGEPSMMVANILHRLIGLLGEKIPAIENEINNILKSGLGEAEKKEAIKNLFVPIAKTVLAIPGKNEDGSFKVWKALNLYGLENVVSKEVENNILPELLSKLYLDMTSWHRQMPEAERRFERVTSNSRHATQVIAGFIEKFIPHYLKTKSEKVTNFVEKHGAKYFNFLSESQRKDVRELIQRNLRKVSGDEEMNPLWQGITEYTKGFIVNIAGGALENVNETEKRAKTASTNPLLLNLFLGGMKDTTGHFRTISKLQGTKAAYRLDHQALLKEFQNNGELHPALADDLDPSATPEQRRKARLDYFFKPMALDLLEISGYSKMPADFPAPEAGREEAWNFFKNTLLPETLLSLYEAALKPINIHKLMGNVIDMIAKATESIDEDEEEETIVPIDESQLQLNKQAGDLIKGLVDMFPASASKFLFSIGHIKKMSSEKLGAAIRKQTNSKSFAELVDRVFKGIKLEDPIEKTEAQLAQESRALHKQVQAKLTRLISRETKKQMRNFVKNKLKSFDQKLEKTTFKWFGAPGLGLKRFFTGILKTVVGFFMPILDFVVFKGIWAVIDLYLWRKAGESMKNAAMPVHENLAFNVTEKAIRFMRDEVRKTKAEDDEDARYIERLKQEARLKELIAQERKAA